MLQLPVLHWLVTLKWHVGSALTVRHFSYNLQRLFVLGEVSSSKRERKDSSLCKVVLLKVSVPVAY